MPSFHSQKLDFCVEGPFTTAQARLHFFSVSSRGAGVRDTPKGRARALQPCACTAGSPTQTHSFLSVRGCLPVLRVKDAVFQHQDREGTTKANSMQIRELGAELSRGFPVWREHQSWLRGPSRGEWGRQQPGQEAAHIKYIPGPACRPGVCLCIRRCSRFLGWWRQGASTRQESPGQSGTCRLHPWG